MEGIQVLWRLPNQGRFKINVHACFFEEPLQNGNVSGIGVVIRNHRGRILRMVAGSLGIQEQRQNELYALLEGLKRAYLDDRFDIELETDNEEAYWEWRNAENHGVIPEHRYGVQELTQRRVDRNFTLDVRLINPGAKALARYIAQHGAHNWNKMVILAGPFGRVFELWCRDMGLGPIGDQFMVVHELDLEADVDVEDAVVDDEMMLAQEMV